MEFKEFRELMTAHIDHMIKDEKFLYTADTSKEGLWETYLESFPKGMNKMFRQRREFDCNCCKGFIRAFGNVVRIKDGEVTSIWDFSTNSTKYQPVLNALTRYVYGAGIRGVFVPDRSGFGVRENRDNASVSIEWSHFYYKLPERFIISEVHDIQEKIAEFRDTQHVLNRSLGEISEEAYETVSDLISQDSLYRGQESRSGISAMRELQVKYLSLSNDKQRSLFCWEQAVKVGPAVGRMRNSSMGTLLKDLTSGMGLDEAVRRYEKVMAPTNYKRPKAIFSRRQVRDAEAVVVEMGLDKALGRRYAHLDDLTVNNILFANRPSRAAMERGPFDDLADSVHVGNAKEFSKIEEVPIDKFVADILPQATELEVLVEGCHESNLVSLIAPKDPEAGSLFKWDNAFSWAYKGNIADSMKQRVKSSGGDVGGELRFSIQWNDRGDNNDDLDAHCREPCGTKIYYRNKGILHKSSGKLDVDVIDPRGKVAVENITYARIKSMPNGTYQMIVHCYSSRGNTKSGFSAEIEYDGEIRTYHREAPLKPKEYVHVANVVVSEGKAEVVDVLRSGQESKEVWGIRTLDFHRVNVLMYSPNYWDEQSGIGNRHYMFMLSGCKNDSYPNGFFNEFLQEDLMKHKRVFEALGSRMAVTEDENQLSGLGFSSTKRSSIVCRVSGSFKRTLRLLF